MSRSTDGPQPFSRWRSYLWPVHYYELKKLVPMLLIFFLISFDYNVLRILKETSLVYAEGSNAEAIPFVKVGVMLPGTFLMTLLFTRLSSRFSREQTFYLLISCFLAFFALYLFFLYPYRDQLHPNVAADWLQLMLPPGFKGMIATIRNWTASSFYAMCELWGNIVLFVLFWGFANQITRLDEAKRFYGLFGVGANFSGIVAGQASIWICRGAYNPALPFGTTAWEQSMMVLISLVLLTGIAALGLFRWMQCRVLTDPRLYKPEELHLDASETKPTFSMRDTVSFLWQSRYILCIAIIVLSYNAVINLTEVIWKEQVKELYSDPNDYTIYMNQVSSLIGLFATLTALFISGNSIRRCGWTFTALLTPLILLVTSVGFFGFYFLKDHAPALATQLIGISPLAIAVFFGSAQNVMSRTAKYSVFDATREMAFIPLNQEEKIKGKAVIDGLCSRLGKSAGAFINGFLLVSLGSFSQSAPYIVLFLAVTIAIWIAATCLLGRRFNALTAAHEPSKRSHPSFSVGEKTSMEAEATDLLLSSTAPLQEQHAV